MHKKELVLFIAINVFLLFLWWSFLSWSYHRALSSLWVSSGTTIDFDNFASRDNSIPAMIQKAQISVVSISQKKDIAFYVDTPDQIYWPWSISTKTTLLGWWSGILISKTWYILTNKHVVQDINAHYQVTTYEWTSYQVEHIWLDEILDLAIIKIKDPQNSLSNFPLATKFLPLRTPITIGQLVFVLGTTTNTHPSTATMGILWWMNKKFTIHGNNTYVWLYQTDAQSSPGNSWWPLIHSKWTILGITTALVEGEGITFALPISQEFINTTLRSIETFGKILRPVIGIQYTEISPALQKEHSLSLSQWIYVTDVLSNLPAWKAWIQIGDVITHINNHPIQTSLPFLYQLYTFLPWETCNLTINRWGKTLNLSVVLGGNTP